MAKIGKRVNAKKYANLRKKQAQANKMIKEAKGRLKQGHDALDRLKEHKGKFYHKRGLKSQGNLSFKNLETKDLDAYENMLDSIINDTYINETKYRQHEEKMKERIKEWFNNDDVTDEMISEFNEKLEGDLFNDLLSQGMTPSELATLESEYVINGLTPEDFYEMIRDFKSSNETIDNFFTYADSYMSDIARNNYLHELFEKEVNMGKWKVDEFETFKAEQVIHPEDDIWR